MAHTHTHTHHRLPQTCQLQPAASLHTRCSAVVQFSYLWAFFHKRQEVSVPRVRPSASDGRERKHKFFIFFTGGGMWGRNNHVAFSTHSTKSPRGRQLPPEYTVFWLLSFSCLTPHQESTKEAACTQCFAVVVCPMCPSLQKYITNS